MKVLLLLIIICLTNLPSFATSTSASKFAEKEYEFHQNYKNVHINVKKEDYIDYKQIFGNKNITSVVFGYGDMKIRGCKKCRISYIVLFDNCKNPFWSNITITK